MSWDLFPKHLHTRVLTWAITTGQCNALYQLPNQDPQVENEAQMRKLCHLNETKTSRTQKEGCYPPADFP